MADSKESWKKEEDEEEEEEELDESSFRSQKDAILFAVDISKSMLTPPPTSDSKKAGTDSPALAAIKCAYQVMQQRIISSPKDMTGVLLFGTEQSKFQDGSTNSKSGLAYPHCYLLTDLDVPSAEDVKQLKGIVEDEDEAKDLLVPSVEPVSMSNLLFCANQIFTTKAPTFGSRRLFIISDNDDPHATDKNSRSQAAVRAKDLYDLGVIIELFPISYPEHDFDRSKFYDDIIYRDPAEGDEAALTLSTFKFGGDGISLLQNLISDINSKQVAKRALFSNLPFEIGPGFKISVKGYNILQKQTPSRSCYIWLGGEAAQIAVGESSKVSEETERTVDKIEIKKAYKFGGTQVLFTPEEQKELKNFGPPGLRIIGFKPQSMLPFWASINKSTFIYPSEEDYVGSTRVFSALWQKLLKDHKIGLGWYIARANATPLLVAIIPSAERKDDSTNGQIIPAGLWLSPLPYADDIRYPPDVPKPPVVAKDELIDEMRKVIQQLQLPKAIYDPSKYPNPSLQWHYRILQAIALEEELPETPEDKTIPKFRQIEKRAGAYLQNWAAILGEQHRHHETERRNNGSVGIKRERDEPEDSSAAYKRKKPKVHVSVSLDGISNSALKKMVDDEGLGKHTIAELKQLAAAKGLSGTGKKGELVERIEGWVEENC